MFDTFSHFNRKSGSSMWPSNDPSDSPFDTFTCKHCGKVEKIRMYGSVDIYGPSFEEQAGTILHGHLSVCEKFKWRK